ncbi:aspartyl protease, partial [Gregarina niphandrodes]
MAGRSLDLFVDTGAQISVLSPQAAADAGLVRPARLIEANTVMGKSLLPVRDNVVTEVNDRTRRVDYAVAINPDTMSFRDYRRFMDEADVYHVDYEERLAQKKVQESVPVIIGEEAEAKS